MSDVYKVMSLKFLSSFFFD